MVLTQLYSFTTRQPLSSLFVFSFKTSISMFNLLFALFTIFTIVSSQNQIPSWIIKELFFQNSGYPIKIFKVESLNLTSDQSNLNVYQLVPSTLQLTSNNEQLRTNISELHPITNHFNPNNNQFSSNTYQFNSNSNQFNSNINQFNSNTNQFNSNAHQFNSNMHQFHSNTKQLHFNNNQFNLKTNQVNLSSNQLNLNRDYSTSVEIATHESSNKVGLNSSVDLACQASQELVGAYLKKLLLFEEVRFRTIEDLEARCALAVITNQHMREYSTKCLKGLLRQIFSLYIRTTRKIIKNVCSSRYEKERILSTIECTTTESPIEWNKCLIAFDQQFDYIAHSSPDDNIVADFCCMHVLFYSCIKTNLGKEPECLYRKNDIVSLFLNLSDIGFKKNVDLMCTRYSTQTACLRNNIDGVEKLKQAANQSLKMDGTFLIGPFLTLFPKLMSQ